MLISIYQINPLTKKLFGKEHIREVIREMKPHKYNEENIEMYERIFMSALCWFVNGGSGFYIARPLYQDILNGKELDEMFNEYYSILYENVKNRFLSNSVWTYKQVFSKKYELYRCNKTIKGKFYEGEVYKKFKTRRGWREGENGYIVGFNLEEKFDKDINGDEFTLVPEGALTQMIIPEEYESYFEKQ